MHHAEQRLGIKAGGTTDDGLFSLHHAECQAACTEAPCLQVNYRYRYRVTTDQLDGLIDDLAAGALDAEIPPHGTLATVRQRIPADRAAGPSIPTCHRMPAWLHRRRLRRRRRERKRCIRGRPVSSRQPTITRPSIVTSRFRYEDSYTLDRYHATDGYAGLRAALARRPPTSTPRSRTPPCSGAAAPASPPA